MSSLVAEATLESEDDEEVEVAEDVEDDVLLTALWLPELPGGGPWLFIAEANWLSVRLPV
jgi:hypothetical protein